MTIEIRNPELEQLVREEILNGHFQNVDDLLTKANLARSNKAVPWATLTVFGPQLPLSTA